MQLTPKITNRLFTCCWNCTWKSNPVCLIQQWSVIFLLASYVQWHYFLVWAYENWPIHFSPSMFTLKGYAVQYFTRAHCLLDWCHCAAFHCTALRLICCCPSRWQNKNSEVAQRHPDGLGTEHNPQSFSGCSSLLSTRPPRLHEESKSLLVAT